MYDCVSTIFFDTSCIELLGRAGCCLYYCFKVESYSYIVAKTRFVLHWFCLDCVEGKKGDVRVTIRKRFVLESVGLKWPLLSFQVSLMFWIWHSITCLLLERIWNVHIDRKVIDRRLLQLDVTAMSALGFQKENCSFKGFFIISLELFPYH